MYSLILESSTKLLLVGLLKNNNLILSKTRIAKKDHAYHISYYVKDILKEANLSPSHIEKVIVGKGPGSYTGVRVAGVFSKVFAHSLNVKLYSISSLFLLTSGYYNKHISFYNAKNDRYYALGFSSEETFLKEDVYKQEDLNTYSDIEQVDLTSDNLEEIYKIDYDIVLKNLKEENFYNYEPNYSYKSKYD